MRDSIRRSSVGYNWEQPEYQRWSIEMRVSHLYTSVKYVNLLGSLFLLINVGECNTNERDRSIIWYQRSPTENPIINCNKRIKFPTPIEKWMLHITPVLWRCSHTKWKAKKKCIKRNDAIFNLFMFSYIFYCSFFIDSNKSPLFRGKKYLVLSCFVSKLRQFG